MSSLLMRKAILGVAKHKEAQIIIEGWRRHYNIMRTHSALGYRPPAPETIISMDHKPTMN